MSKLGLPELMDMYKLTPFQMQRVQDNIIEEFTNGVTSTANPKLIVLGAQPGAGKTELQKLSEVECLKNVVVCNGDNFRDYHPFAREIKKYHEILYPEVTAVFTHPWSLGLQKHCREKKLSYILETTLQNGEGVNNILKRGKDEGFSTELKVLAINGKLSYLGTELRYENMVKHEGYGRIVGKTAHDLRYQALPNAFKFVTERRLYNDLNIYARDLIIDGSKEKKAIRLIAHNLDKPVSLYLKERDRPWTKQENEYFNSRVQEVISMKENRGLSKQEIERFKKNLSGYDEALKQNQIRNKL